jgi:hypothetical protein
MHIAIFHKFLGRLFLFLVLYFPNCLSKFACVCVLIGVQVNLFESLFCQ